MVAAWIVVIPVIVLSALAVFGSLASSPAMIIFLMLPVAAFYAIGRLREAELVGHSVEVTPLNFPEIHDRVGAMKRRLGADDLSVRVFVISSGDYNLSMGTIRFPEDVGA